MGKVQVTLTGHCRWTSAIAFSSDGGHIASASDDNTIKVWDAATGDAHIVSTVTFSLDGQRLASASHDATVKM
jgi:WD40 repeat protein